MEYAETLAADITENPNLLYQNAESLSREINWFAQYVNSHLKNYFPKEVSTEKNEALIEEKSAGDEYLGNSIPASQDHVIATDQVEFEENLEHDTRYKHEQQLPEDEPQTAQANNKKIF